MRAPGKIRLTIYVLAFAGAALFTALLIHQGVGQVLDAFATGEWGILGVVVFHLIPLFLDTIAWWVLFPRSDRLPLRQLFWMRWIGESISALVPSATIGGDIVRARLAAIHGASLPVAAGTVLVDITLGIFVQAGFTLLGLVLLVTATGKKQLCWSNFNRNRDRPFRLCRLLLRAATRNFSFSRSHHFAVGWFLGLAIPRARRRYAGSNRPFSLRAAECRVRNAVPAPWPHSSSAREKFGSRFGSLICPIHF